MTEDEFCALLAIEGRELHVDMLSGSPVYYVAVVRHPSKEPYFAIAESPEEAVRKLIAQYYANN